LPAELLRVNAQSPEPDLLRYAGRFYRPWKCDCHSYGTLFYGLAADPFNLAAVDEIYRVKGRPETRALPILVNSIEQAVLLGARSAAEISASRPGVLAGRTDAGGQRRSAHPLESYGRHGTHRIALAEIAPWCGA